MSVYVLIESRVKDREKYKGYIAAFSDIIAKCGGRYLVRGGRIKPLVPEMEMERRQPERINIVEFPSEADQRRCFASPEYRAIVALRQAAADTRALLLEGYVPENH